VGRRFEEPGAWVAAQARRRERVIWAGIAGFCGLSTVVIVLAVDQRLSVLTSLVFLLSVVAAKPYAERYLDGHIRWLRGARAEEAVGRALMSLVKDGWTVVHDVMCYGPPNLDHVAWGPSGTFAIETKARRYDDAHLARVKRQAARLHDDLGVWVTPVICLRERGGSPFRSRGVWVVPEQHLVGWLNGQRGGRQPRAENVERFLEACNSSN
jgi:hypothetical protein